MDLLKRIDSAVDYIRSKTDFTPEVGMILGSGLGDYANTIENPVVIDYSSIQGFPVSTVEGHAGRFVMGLRHGKRVMAMQGRFHYYEGYSQQVLTIPVRVMKRLGVKTLLVTNAAGGVNKSFGSGALMVITDHINYSGANPLTGQNLDQMGPRFPDMTYAYSRELRQKLLLEAKQAGITLEEGVYIMFSGPNYETPAEIRFARTAGADAVGMSTVPEVIVARQCGMEVVGISCITNMAAGVLDAPLNHAEVMETSRRKAEEFKRTLDVLLTKVL